MVIKLLKGLFARKTDESILFVDVYREYIDKYLKENDVCEPTANRYENYWRNFTTFLASHHLYHMRLSDVRIKHAEQFRGWLKQNFATTSVRHASRQVEMWKRVSRYAVMMEYLVNDYLAPIKAQRDKARRVIALDQKEIAKLSCYNFHSDMMRIVADLFLFQCYTGLAYADLYKFRVSEKSGKPWIEGERQKSDESYRNYFFDEAIEIYNKYQGHLPKISNQKYNEYLKEIAHLLKIDKRLTTHVGRKTHATLLTLRGVGAMTGSLVLGNTSKVFEESYVDKTDAIIENEFTRLGIQSRLLN